MAPLIIPIFWGIDILASYIHTIYYIKKNPKDKEWYEMEFNIMTKYFWKKYGVHKGTKISVLVSIPFLIFITYYLNTAPDLFYGIIIGVYIMIFVSHYMNFKFLFRKN